MAGEYQVIARKWRPQRFADMVGQEHIVATLKNAIRQRRTAHAYLFVGPRGIGKTTTARIFAKALNCEAPEDGEPCCKCQSCLSIANESNMDVIEIDAASQNSVDNIRDLRDEVMHVPVNSRYKIYIIDEVHMLSKQAWNALLKTVEEPPKHVKFIFATTEVHMVLPTIISRCQRFDLQRIATRMIAGRLAEIAKTENVKISGAAIEAIARAADGGMRDAQSLLDQMIAFFGSTGDNEINEDQVLSLFGLTAATDVENLVMAILGNQKAAVIANIHALAARGKNLETLLNDVLSFMRGIELSQLLENPENILEDGTEAIAVYRRLAASVRPEVVQRLLESLAPTGRLLHEALNKQIYLETVILKAMRTAHAMQVDDLIARLNQIRNAGELEIVQQVPQVVAAPLYVAPPMPVVELKAPEIRSVPTPVAAPAPQVEVPVATAVATPAPAPQPEPIPEVKPEPAAVEPIPQPEPIVEAPVVQAAEPEPVVEIAPEPVAEAIPEAMPEPELAPAPQAENNDEPLGNIEEQATAEEVEESKVYDVDPYLETPAPEAEIAEEEEEEIEEFNPVMIWADMIERARNELEPRQCDLMTDGLAESFRDEELLVVFDAEFDQEALTELAPLTEQMKRFLGETTGHWEASVKLEARKGLKQHDAKNLKPRRHRDELHRLAAENPSVQMVRDLFEGEIVDVHER